MKSCVTAIEHGRDDYSRAVHLKVEFKITTETGRDDHVPGECGVHDLDSVRIEIVEPRDKYNLPIYVIVRPKTR